VSGGRAALVQGASRGLGLGFVRQLLDGCAFEQVIATARQPCDSPDLLALRSSHPAALRLEPIDVTEELSIASAAERIGRDTPKLQLLVNCAGILHNEKDVCPEKRLEAIDPSALRRVFEVNAFGPLLVAKHFLPLLRHSERAVLANVSARVGSIGDNRLGGWYAYRASKSAQNMFTRTLAIELARRAPNAICVALHPGTVDTDLSRPFQRNVAPGRLFDPDRAASQLLAVVDGLTPEQSGSFLAWDGAPIPW
jgi:NAD(P)-dependent dehydrogenase (short-subunit alcohol dehydrogenase family)